MLRRPLPALLLLLVAFGSMGLQCGWGPPLEGLATHCPPRTIDCGPGCIEEGTTCCDDSPSGGLSQCPTAGGGLGKKCLARGIGTCPPNTAAKFCCGESTLGLVNSSTDIDETLMFSGNPGVFCGNTVIRAGDECCSAVDAKKICRFTAQRALPTGNGGGAGGGLSCSAAGPGWMGSARSCVPLGAGGSCSCSAGATNRCITKSEFDSAGLAFPAACKPSGETGCLDTSSGTLIAPCCPGLTCKVGSVCSSSGAGGKCIQ